MAGLAFYPPAAAMLDAYAHNFDDDSLIAAEEEFTKYLTSSKLKMDNISSILSNLLSIEDITTMYNFAQLMETNVIVKSVKNVHRIELTPRSQNAEDVLIADIDELVLVPKESLIESPLPKPIILAQLPHRHELIPWKKRKPEMRHVGSIIKVHRTYIEFSYNSHYGSAILKNKKFDVIFRSPRIPFRLMYRALAMLKLQKNLCCYLFPKVMEQQRHLKTMISESECLSLINSSIAENAEQLQAVQQIVSGPSKMAPYIVYGPPGTGKTTTIVEAILQLYLRGNDILVTAGSNTACDTIALQICKYIENNNHFDSGNKPKEIMTRCYSKLRLKKVHQLKNLHPLLRKHSNYCINVDVRRYRIVVATLCTAAMLARSQKLHSLSYIFIDEAATSSEPEALLGIVGVKGKRCHVILSGDHKQLGPVIKNKRAESLGLGKSLMERLLLRKVYKVEDSGKYDCTLQTRLIRNYRSHPEILGIFNKLYYGNEIIPLAPLELVNQAANWSILPNTKFPILFQATFGRTSHNHTTSSFNSLEAEVACWFVMTLRKNGLGQGKEVTEEDIGIITPYLAQSTLLKEKLRQRNYRRVNVGSVGNFQGREKPIIIASMVSSFRSPGFAADPRRLNVLLSRAKSLLILVGNPLSLSQNSDFKFIIDQCKLHGNFKANRKMTRKS